jgi:hypothetical protein
MYPTSDTKHGGCIQRIGSRVKKWKSV